MVERADHRVPSGVADARRRPCRTERSLIVCLTCGCMDAHLEMGEKNIRYEDLKRAADENGRTVAETIDIMERTEAKDREEHRQEYASAAAS
jgi:hypothetical protein